MQSFQFADMAAELALFQAFVKQVDPVFADHVFHFAGRREKHFHLYMVMILGTGYQLVCFGKKPSCIKREDPHARVYSHHHVSQYLVFGSQAGGQSQTFSVFLHEKPEHLLRGGSGKSLVPCFNLLS